MPGGLEIPALGSPRLPAIARLRPSGGSGCPTFRRAITDPSALVADPSATTSDSDDEADQPLDPLLRGRARRGACELNRHRGGGGSQFSLHSVEPSKGSLVAAAGPGGDGAQDVDGVAARRYKVVAPLHKSARRTSAIHCGRESGSNKVVVFKAYAKHDLINITTKQHLENEIQVLQALAGTPGVSRLLDVMEDEDNKYLALAQAPGRTLIEVMASQEGRLREDAFAADVLIPLLQVLAAVHARGYVHRQVKPEHVMVGRGGVCLLDFSIAAGRGCLHSSVGPLEYAAPEVLLKPDTEEVFHKVLYNGMEEDDLPQYDERADVFSLGVLSHEALTGRQPFAADDAGGMMAAQREGLKQDGAGVPRVLRGLDLSPEALAFLAAALEPDPAQRPLAGELLEHAYVRAHWQEHLERQASSCSQSGVALV